MLEINVSYKCDAWSLGNIAEIETCHLQFMKQTLKIKKTISSCVVQVYAETRRFPLSVYINMFIIQCWNKLFNIDVKQLYVACREILDILGIIPGSDILKSCYVAMDLEISGTTSQ